MKVGPLHLEAGTMRVKRCSLWLPHGLHLWVGRYGVHLFWHYSPHTRRVVFEREAVSTDAA